MRLNMRAGEKGILILIGVIVVTLMGYRTFKLVVDEPDPGIPFYTTASHDVKRTAELIYKRNGCDTCHALWLVRNMMSSVPAPALDGIGSLRDEAWFYEYLSAEQPQSILPSRLKKEFQMPSYAHLPAQERRLLASYMASLKVEDWYLHETKKAEYEKLTGKPYTAAASDGSTSKK